MIAAGTALTLVMVIGVEVRPRGVIGSLLASPPMRWLGQRSYSIYLWNVLARIAVLSWLGHTFVGDVVWVAVFVVVAEASFRFVERPLRARLARRRGAYVEVAEHRSALGWREPRPQIDGWDSP